jgi:hypothetical protein
MQSHDMATATDSDCSPTEAMTERAFPPAPGAA